MSNDELMPMVGSLAPTNANPFLEHNHGVQEEPSPQGECPRCDFIRAQVENW